MVMHYYVRKTSDLEDHFEIKNDTGKLVADSSSIESLAILLAHYQKTSPEINLFYTSQQLGKENFDYVNRYLLEQLRKEN